MAHMAPKVQCHLRPGMADRNTRRKSPMRAVRRDDCPLTRKRPRRAGRCRVFAASRGLSPRWCLPWPDRHRSSAGRASEVTASSLTTTSSTLSMPGRSNIVSSRMSSRIERRPRAPVLRAMARLAIALSASSVKVSCASSSSNRRWYCLTSAFLGSVRMVTSASSSRSSSVAMTGRRPTNSGISPNFSRSSGSRSVETSPMPRSSASAHPRRSPSRCPCRAAR